MGQIDWFALFTNQVIFFGPIGMAAVWFVVLDWHELSCALCQRIHAFYVELCESRCFVFLGKNIQWVKKKMWCWETCLNKNSPSFLLVITYLRNWCLFSLFFTAKQRMYCRGRSKPYPTVVDLVTNRTKKARSLLVCRGCAELGWNYCTNPWSHEQVFLLIVVYTHLFFIDMLNFYFLLFNWHVLAFFFVSCF